MGNLYGSLEKTTVLQITPVPPPPPGIGYNMVPYSHRGWCCFEDGAAKIAAYNNSRRVKLIDISKAPFATRVLPTMPPSVARLEKRIARAKFTGKADRDEVMALLKKFNTLLDAKAITSSKTRGWWGGGGSAKVGLAAVEVVPQSEA